MQSTGDRCAISVIIAARNEAKNLAKNLPHVVAQMHSNFEVVVSLDNCTDSSFEVMKQIADSNKNVRCITIQNDMSHGNKKKALTEAISHARHECLVFTDADCKPFDQLWLSRFDRAFDNGHTLIIGSGMFYEEDSIVNSLYRLSAILIALKYFAAAWLGRPYMAVGRSMGYTKTLFQSVNGFEAHDDIASGDDDLFVSMASKNASVALMPDALTISRAPKTWKAWLGQLNRHQNAGKKYEISALLMLWTYHLTDLTSTLGMLVFFTKSYQHNWSMFFVLYVLKISITALAISRMARLMNYNLNVFALIFYQPLLSLLYPLFSVFNLFSKSGDWQRQA